MKGSIKQKKLLSGFLRYALMILILVYIVYPIFLVVISSFKSTPEVLKNVFSLPQQFAFENYARAWEKGTLYSYYGNSLIVTLIAVPGVVLFSSFVAFALSRNNCTGRNLIYILFLIGIAIPLQVGIIPEYLLLTKLKLLNTRIGLALVYIAYGLPLGVFIMYNYFRKIPHEIQEAGVIDGCGPLQTYLRIVMPISRGPVTSVAIFSLVTVWNDMFFPLILITKRAYKTLPTGLLGFKGEFSTDYATMFAGVVLVSLPIIIAYVLFQKQFMEGMTAGSVKG